MGNGGEDHIAEPAALATLRWLGRRISFTRSSTRDTSRTSYPALRLSAFLLGLYYRPNFFVYDVAAMSRTNAEILGYVRNLPASRVLLSN
jgi:hypothetical protein